jgi:hypothetical protein
MHSFFTVNLHLNREEKENVGLRYVTLSQRVKLSLFPSRFSAMGKGFSFLHATRKFSFLEKKMYTD